MNQEKHLILYDGACGLCTRVVQFLLKWDKNEIFDFAPLDGPTAAKYLEGIPPEDTSVLIENYQLPGWKSYILGVGVFRMLWLLGLPWSILGIFCFLPGFLYNWAYRLVARHRSGMFNQFVCLLPEPKNKHRFLP